jgi:hypothetical protein
VSSAPSSPEPGKIVIPIRSSGEGWTRSR